MKILWLNPLNVSKNLSSISQKDFMVSEKNEIARSIKLLGHEITGVFCFIKEKVDMNGFSNSIYFELKRPKLLYIVFYHLKMLASAFNQKYDVILFGVHSSHLIFIIKLISALKSLKPVLILDIRSVPVDLKTDVRSKIRLIRYNLAIKIADCFCDGITCITPMLGDTLKPMLKKLKEKIGYFQTGVNFRIFDPTNSSSLRKKLNLDNKFILIYHGVLSPNRGLQNVLRAIALCKQHIPNILFMIVGTGAAELELKKITKELKLEKNVLFTGAVSFEQIPDFIKSADVSIIPLPAIDWWNVSSPIKLKEYLAMQLPVIATDIPAHRLVVEKTGGATLIKSHEPKHIAEAVLDFYNNRKKIYPMKSRKELYDVISYKSQARKFIEYVSITAIQ
jgi:glycosyltransferase involved in cell wall biosynthesis